MMVTLVVAALAELGMTKPGKRLSTIATTSNPPNHLFIILCISLPPTDLSRLTT
jgi:hypothetical protein